jgi:hypothetical protein
MISISIMCALVILLFGGNAASPDEQHIARGQEGQRSQAK